MINVSVGGKWWGGIDLFARPRALQHVVALERAREQVVAARELVRKNGEVGDACVREC